MAGYRFLPSALFFPARNLAVLVLPWSANADAVVVAVFRITRVFFTLIKFRTLGKFLPKKNMNVTRVFHGSGRVGSCQGDPNRPMRLENLLARPVPTREILYYLLTEFDTKFGNFTTPTSHEL